MTVSSAVDLRHMFGVARNQGRRPTCLAFAASDAHAALRDGWYPLSCEYIFHKAQSRAGKPPTKGASLSFMLEALRQDGQPEEAGWPYLTLVPANSADWTPPGQVGALYRRKGDADGAALGSILANLDQGRPVILLSYLSESFYTPSAEAVISPVSGENPDPEIRHAIVAVGHGTWNGERVVLVRNSWGSTWGNAGYAWATETFLAPRIFAAAILTENIDVSGNSVAA